MTGPLVNGGGGRSRRELVSRGIAVGGAGLAAGAIPFLLGIRGAFAKARGDAAVLEAAIELEQRAVLAYTTLAERGKLGPVARLFAEHEQEHADALRRSLRERGGSPPPRPERAADVPGLVEAAAGDALEVTTFAIELETMAVAAYFDAQAELRSPQLLTTAASIMANQAQHLVVLRQALGRNPLPRAFVTGRS